MSCDFCDEINGKETVYNKIYGTKNRFVYSTEHFLVFPCMGQLREGHLLIASKPHVNAIGMLDGTSIEELECLTLAAGEFFRKKYGKELLCFEHGVLNDDGTNGGCGIYHMHLHLLPIDYAEFLTILERIKAQETNMVCSVRGLEDTSRCVSTQRTYIYLSCIREAKAAESYLVNNTDNYFASQYMRKTICEVLGKTEWDWRKILYAEPAFLNTLEKSRAYFSTKVDKM